MVEICGGNRIITAQARVVIGNISISTPNVQAITVSRQRGTPQSKASCSVRIDQSDISSVSQGDICFITFFGNAVFTGVVRRVQAVPTNRCAGEYFLNIQAEDKLYLLENRKITRRQKLEGLGPMAIISSKKDTPERGFDTTPGGINRTEHSNFGSPQGFQTRGSSLNPREITSIIGSGASSSPAGENHPVTRTSRRLSENRGTPGGGAAGIHDHSDLTNLGPAFAVYGTK